MSSYQTGGSRAAFVLRQALALAQARRLSRAGGGGGGGLGGGPGAGVALRQGNEVAAPGADVHLAGAGDLLLRVLDHLPPLGKPAGVAGDGEQDGKHVHGEPHRLVDDAGVEVYVRVELALDEVVVFEGDALKL